MHVLQSLPHAICTIAILCAIAMDDEEWMDLFDDNSSDEDSVELNPDDTDTATALSTEPSSVCVDCAPPKRKKRSSNKRQK